jgi:hypothetical protein
VRQYPCRRLVGLGLRTETQRCSHGNLRGGYRTSPLGCRDFAGRDKAGDAGGAVYVPAAPNEPAERPPFPTQVRRL